MWVLRSSELTCKEYILNHNMKPLLFEAYSLTKGYGDLWEQYSVRTDERHWLACCTEMTGVGLGFGFRFQGFWFRV